MATISDGSWSGDGPACSVEHTALIQTALSDIQGVLDGWDLPCLTDLRDQLQDYLDCSIEIECEDCEFAGMARRGSDSLTMCEDFMDGATQQRITAVVFHEMVHAAGGTELDSEALENHFFASGGATTPTSGDWPKFHDDEGEFVIWDEDSGEVFEKCVEEGSWNESDSVSQGAQLNVSFIEPAGGDDGGGW